MEFKLLNLVIYTILLTCPCFADETHVTYISPDQVKDIGEEVVLNCTVKNPKKYYVSWVKDRSTISLSEILAARSDRFKIKYDNATDTFSLHIHNITTSDSGSYECQILESFEKKVTSTVELQVRRPPTITNISEASLYVSEGQQAQMICTADGYPKPDITWKRDNDAILPTGGSNFNGSIYKIESANKEDRGIYVCYASNGVGETVRKNLLLEVDFLPVMSAKRPKVAQAVGYEVELICKVEAYPPPAISWIKDSKPLQNSDGYEISHFASNDELTVSTLKLSNVEKQHYGDYICKAINKVGNSETRINFYEQDLPNNNFVDAEKQKSDSSETTPYNHAIIIMAIMFSIIFY